MLDFFQSKRFKVLILVLSLLFGMLLYSASHEGVNNIPKNMLEIVSTPFQMISARITATTDEFFDRIVNYQDTILENERLIAENAELHQKLIDYEKIRDENEQYRTMAGIKEIYPDFEISMAFVISRDPSDRFSSFMIDRGELHGVSINDPIITPSGLVGIVTNVGPISSRVQTILSPENNVSSIEVYSKELGILTGDISLSQDGNAKFSILSSDTVIKKGDMITTTNVTGLYPAGIPIGTVIDVKAESHGVTKYAIIKPFVDIEDVTTVQVITGFLGQGSELIDYLK